MDRVDRTTPQHTYRILGKHRLMRHEPSTERWSLTRRRFLAVSAFGTLSLASPGHWSRIVRAEQAGVVWTQRSDTDVLEYWADVAAGTDRPFVLCGRDKSASSHTRIRTTDQWGRQQSQRRGPEWGTGGFELVSHDDGYLMAGVADSAPLLIGFPDESASEFLVPEWRVTYDGRTAGPVYATSTAAGHAVGWTETAEVTSVVVGTDDTGTERWTDRLGSREVVTLGPAPTSAGAVLGMGTRDGGSAGWVTVWTPEGARDREQSFETPGDGPSAAVVDGSAVIVTGRTDDGFWLQKRTADWSVEWTRTVSVTGRDHGVDDVVARTDGYGLLAHDDRGALVVRTDETGAERWRGQYAPYSEGAEDRAPVRGHAMVPVAGDEFVVAGSVRPGTADRDSWVARIGEPGIATPAAVPEPTPSPTPTGPLTRTPTPSAGDTTPADDTATPIPTATAPASPTATPGVDGPGFGLLAGLAGVLGWLLTGYRTE